MCVCTCVRDTKNSLSLYDRSTKYNTTHFRLVLQKLKILFPIFSNLPLFLKLFHYSLSYEGTFKIMSMSEIRSKQRVITKYILDERVTNIHMSTKFLRIPGSG